MHRAAYLPACAALIAWAASEAEGQISLSQPVLHSAAQRAMPATGPGSSRFNPAALSETRLAHALGGRYHTLSGKGGEGFLHLSAATPEDLFPAFPFGFAGGFDLSETSSSLDNTNALYRESVIAPSLALFLQPAETGWRTSAGVAIPIQLFNAFGVAADWSPGVDVGLLGSIRAGAGAFRLGFAYHNLVSPDLRLPGGRGGYALPAWMEFSVGWISPGGKVRIYGEHFLYELYYRRQGADKEDRFGMNAWELEFRPHPLLGVKLERPRIATLTSLGFLLHPPYRPFGIGFFLEANLGHDRYTPPHLDVFLLGDAMKYLFGEGVDEGRGTTIGLTLGAGL